MLRFTNVGLRFCSNTSQKWQLNCNRLETNTSSIIENQKPNMPIEMENPYAKQKTLCFLCKYEIKPDYKNVRLLSQFVSRFTGKIYGRHITGLCKKQQENVEKEIWKAIKTGLMAHYYREPRFSNDPKLFDPDNPFRPHRF